MKSNSAFKFTLITAVFVAAAQFAGATVYTWNWTNGVSADMNWSDSLNWSPVGVPGAADSLIFNNVNSGGACVASGPGLNIPGGGQSQINIANFNGVVDSGFGGTISFIVCSNLASTYQNILITNNATLAITNNWVLGNGSNVVATGAITPGSGGTDYGTVSGNVTLAGTNATLLMNNTNETLWVTEGSANNSSSVYFALDMSALDYFNATISRLLVGVPAVNRPGGTIYLAATNNITAEYQTTGALTSDTVGTGAVVVADSTSNGGGAANDLYLGLVNILRADTIAIGRQKQAHGLIAFNPNLTGPLVPTATFQGFTTNRVLVWDIGDGVANSGTDTTTGTADFSLGIVNAAVSNMYVGKGPSAGTAANASTGTLTFGAGTFNINSFYIGYHNNTSAPYGNGTVNVNTNSTIDDYATLVVNSNLYLTYAIPTAPSAPGSIGTLNITGGAVFANNISSATNGHSTLNMTAGTLVITNFAGTLTAPISNLTVGGTIQLSVSGGVPEMVASNLTIAAPVTVNIAAVPVILKYPAQYPLIKYEISVSGDPTQVRLGGLPSGSPSYAGYLSNNAANSSIDLVLTSGAIVTGEDIWTGAANSNWDTTSINWIISGNPANFDDGIPAQFDDSARGPTNINLTTILSPAQVTVSNSLLAYTFSGPGAIAGPGALIKEGTNTLLITNTGNNTFSGGLIISNGTVQFGNGGADGNLPANGADILDDGTLIFDQSPNVSVPSPITGTGSVIQEGLGVLDLTASNSYAGITLVDSGTFLLDGWLNGGLLTNAPGTTVGGNGTNLGPFTVAGTINPGDVNAVGTLTAGDSLTLAPGSLAYFDLSTIYNTPGSGYNDLLQVTGNLNVNGNSIWVNIQGIPTVGNEWEVITYTGSLSGSFNPVLAGTHFTGVVDTSQTGEVNVSITGGTGANLKWDSTSSGVWDNLTSNWFNFATLAPDFFGSGDNVQFDDSVPNVQTNITIAAGVVVYPNAITNISSINNYTISGLGTISGPAVLVKDGASTLTINTTNSFSGGVTVLNGTLRAGSGTALGSTAGTTTTIENGATFDDNAQDMGAEQFVVSGAGVGGNGALVNNSATAQEDAFQLVSLAGDTTFGGIGRWDMRAGTTTLNTQGTPCNVTKVGTNQVSLVGCNCSDPNLENINVIDGTFAIQTSSTQYGDPNGVITVSSNAQIEVWALTAGLDKNILLLDGGQIWSENNQTTISGTVYLTNNAANTAPGTGIITNDANDTGYSLVVSSTITGPGNLLKTGSGTTELAAVNTYTGGTTVAVGTLLLAGGASLATTTNFDVGSGATFDVSQVSPWSLSVGQTLLGSGTVNGSVAVPAGATIAPGTPSATGTLTIVNGVTLAGNTVMKINGLTGASDTLSSPSGGSIVLGGSLVISNLGNVAPKIGQTFTLFSTPALSGTFATILPATPGAGLLWNTNNLAVNGTVSVIAGIQTLDFAAPSRSGNVVTISGVGGTPNALYYVLTSTNLALPLSDWTPVATNNFNSSGDFSYNVTNNPSGSQQFYTIEQP